MAQCATIDLDLQNSLRWSSGQPSSAFLNAAILHGESFQRITSRMSVHSHSQIRLDTHWIDIWFIVRRLAKREMWGLSPWGSPSQTCSVKNRRSLRMASIVLYRCPASLLVLIAHPNPNSKQSPYLVAMGYWLGCFCAGSGYFYFFQSASQRGGGVADFSRFFLFISVGSTRIDGLRLVQGP